MVTCVGTVWEDRALEEILHVLSAIFLQPANFTRG
jgi:hypothetical protein